jgi:hypothetical protein
VATDPLRQSLEDLGLALGMIPNDPRNLVMLDDAQTLLRAMDAALYEAEQAHATGYDSLPVLIATSYTAAAVVAQAAIKAPSAEERDMVLRAWAQGALATAIELHRQFARATRRQREQD